MNFEKLKIEKFNRTNIQFWENLKNFRSENCFLSLNLFAWINIGICLKVYDWNFSLKIFHYTNLVFVISSRVRLQLTSSWKLVWSGLSCIQICYTLLNWVWSRLVSILEGLGRVIKLTYWIGWTYRLYFFIWFQIKLHCLLPNDEIRLLSSCHTHR